MTQSHTNISTAVIQKLKAVVPHTNSLEEVSLRIPSRIGQLQAAQSQITKKNAVSQLPGIVQKCVGLYSPAITESWPVLFKRQLTTVTALAADVDYVVHIAEERSTQFQKQLYHCIDTAIHTRDAKQALEKKLPKAYKSLEATSDASLEQRKAKIAAEFAVYDTVLESSRLADASTFDTARIDFLQKNALFYMGLLASAKQVSTKTKQLCSTLDTLVDVYATIDPLAQTLHAVGDGVDTLKVHTAQLSHTYENALAATLRQNPADVVLPSVQEPIDAMVYNMLDAAEKKLE